MVAKKLYPIQQNVKCAYCGEKAIRTVLSTCQRNTLYFCNDEHRLLRRRAVRAGDMKPIRPNTQPKKKKKCTRTRIEDLAHLNPTKWELAL